MQSQGSSKQLDYYNCYIQPGQVAYSKDPTLIGAVCGNGVLVFIQDRVEKAGGVSHCVFPKVRRHEKQSNYHVDVGLNSLVKSLHYFDSRNSNLEAQLYGGGDYKGYEKKRAERVIKRIRKALRKMNIVKKTKDAI